MKHNKNSGIQLLKATELLSQNWGTNGGIERETTRKRFDDVRQFMRSIK